MSDLIDGRDLKQPVQPHNPYGYSKPLPNASAILVLGIISIVTSCAYGVPGLICGIIALALFKKDLALYHQDPATYENSFRNAKAGQVCAIIGTSISGLYVLILLIALLAIGLH